MIEKSLSLKIKSHALAEYPRESCGLVLDGKITGRYIEGDYHPLPNVHPTPELAFRIEPSTYLEFDGRVTAVVHSHPDAPAAPSASDMVSQASVNKPFIIVATDGTNCEEPFEFGDCLERLPLQGRAFRHAVSDCYELIRDHFFLELGVNLPSIARDWQWWDSGLDLYSQYFEPAGFRRLAEGEEPQKHDAFFLAVGSKVPNHGGIYLGNGMIRHHLGSMRTGPFSPNHLSVDEFGGRWSALNPIFVRYEGKLP